MLTSTARRGGGAGGEAPAPRGDTASLMTSSLCGATLRATFVTSSLRGGRRGGVSVALGDSLLKISLTGGVGAPIVTRTGGTGGLE